MATVPNDRNTTIRNIFARNLCYYLEKRACSQATLSKHLNVSSAAVSMWCNGKKIPRMDKIESICNLLNIQKSDLLEDKPENERSIDPQIAEIIQQQTFFLMQHPEYLPAFYLIMNTSEEDLPLVISFLQRLADNIVSNPEVFLLANKNISDGSPENPEPLV